MIQSRKAFKYLYQVYRISIHLLKAQRRILDGPNYSLTKFSKKNLFVSEITAHSNFSHNGNINQPIK